MQLHFSDTCLYGICIRITKVATGQNGKLRKCQNLLRGDATVRVHLFTLPGHSGSVATPSISIGPNTGTARFSSSVKLQ